MMAAHANQISSWNVGNASALRLVINKVVPVAALSQNRVKNNFMGFLLERFIAPMENYEVEEKRRFLAEVSKPKNSKIDEGNKIARLAALKVPSDQSNSGVTRTTQF